MHRATLKSLPQPSADRRHWVWVPLAGLVVIVYLTTQVTLARIGAGELSVLVFQPLLWTYVALTSFVIWRYVIRDKPQPRPGLIALSAAIGIFQVSLWLLAGLIFGFGRSPYGREASVLVGNGLFALSALIGLELARACVVVSLSRRSVAAALALGVVLFTLVSIPAGQYATLGNLPGTMRFAGEILFPTLARNLLASILALLAGPLASIAYLGILVGAEWSLPILPDLEWIVAAFVGALPVALGMLAVEEYVSRTAAREGRKKTQRPSVSGIWLLASAAGVTLLFFNTGAFGYRPTLVSGPSMQPSLSAGDVVITEPVDDDDVKVGDVIRFRTEEGFILHRVVRVEASDDGLRFVTRGDGNNVDDLPVSAEQLEGRMILRLPAVGWIAIGFRSLIDSLP